ncbi:hypothetical protein [Burkholderia cenocepacia]|uniref:hypothetical protein n=1 Tax=Burkholderia cenocepacia TaxID=95486 RepID=UPI001B9B54B5|nr:hypothetical protein [Burkholderia cenocepacia]MBR8475793.1 hypothetical protein [Burkholderia cenocepacia]
MTTDNSRADALTDQTQAAVEAGRADLGEPASSAKAQDGFQAGSNSAPMKSADALSVSESSRGSRSAASSADALTVEQRHAVDEAVRVLRDNWEHGTAADLDMAFLPNQSGEESIKECDTDDEYRWPSAETPAPSPADERSISDGMQNFACYLIDNCEGETITEESIQAWLGSALANPRYARASSANETGAEGAPDLEERAHLAAGQWANSNTPIAEALAYRDGFIAGARSHEK